MDTNEAMKQIDEIHRVIEGSNKAFFSGERMIVTGLMVALIPAIEWATRFLTFGVEAIANSGAAITLIHTAFYWGLFSLVGRLLPFKKMDRTQLHPLIQKAFSISRPFMFALIGTIFSLAAIGQGQLIHPMVFILLGFLFSLYGRFSIPAVSHIAWSYLVAGVGYAYLTKFNLEHLWIAFVIFQGLSLVVMGLFLRKEQGAA